jgi:hypothetical protein
MNIALILIKSTCHVSFKIETFVIDGKNSGTLLLNCTPLIDPLLSMLLRCLRFWQHFVRLFSWQHLWIFTTTATS